MTIIPCLTDKQIFSCFPVMSQLRSDYDEVTFLAAVKHLQSTQGYELACLQDEGRIGAAVGFRFGESLAWGKYVYVDDLVSDSANRSRGHGKRLLDWVADMGLERGCKQLHLDSGVQRFEAHRFYLRERMDIVFHHFRKML